MSEIYLVLLLPDWLREDFFSVKVVAGSVVAVKISDSSFTFSFDVRLLSGVFNMSLAASSKILIYQFGITSSLLSYKYLEPQTKPLNIQRWNSRCVLSGKQTTVITVTEFWCTRHFVTNSSFGNS